VASIPGGVGAELDIFDLSLINDTERRRGLEISKSLALGFAHERKGAISKDTK